MTATSKENWNRTLTIAGSICIPLATIAFWLIVTGTKLVDKVDEIGLKQIENHKEFIDFKQSIYSEFKQIHGAIDTIKQVQHDENLLKKYGINK
jgi:hypothetical protein